MHISPIYISLRRMLTVVLLLISNRRDEWLVWAGSCYLDKLPGLSVWLIIMSCTTSHVESNVLYGIIRYVPHELPGLVKTIWLSFYLEYYEHRVDLTVVAKSQWCCQGGGEGEGDSLYPSPSMDSNIWFPVGVCMMWKGDTFPQGNRYRLVNKWHLQYIIVEKCMVLEIVKTDCLKAI